VATAAASAASAATASTSIKQTSPNNLASPTTNAQPFAFGSETGIAAHFLRTSQVRATPNLPAIGLILTLSQQHISFEESSDNDSRNGSLPDNPAPTRKRYPIVGGGYSSVVEIDNSVVAISCFVGECYANATRPSDPCYFLGVEGLRQHVTQAHPEVGYLGIEEVAARCSKVPLTPPDQERVKRRKRPTNEIDYVFKNGTMLAGHKKYPV
jgi:hypothetical protein